MKVLNKFYASCALSSIGDRLWFFALSMYFVTINENNLLMTALNGFTCNLFSIILGAQIGSQIDKYPRLNVVKISLFIQNITVAVTCSIVVVILLLKESINQIWNGSLLYILQGIMILLNVLSTLSSTATKISIEKDWVIVIAEHVDRENKPPTDEIIIHEQNTDNTRRFKEHLSHINAIVRRIDLSTQVLAPLVAGIIMSFFKITPSFNGTVVSAIFFAVWNLVSYAIEFGILKSVYNDVPKLDKKSKYLSTKLKRGNFCKPAVNLYNGWSAYMHQGASLMPSLALSVLFLTVLSFDSITLGYAKSQNLTEMFIAILQGVGSISGILGTFAFELFHNRFKIFLPKIGIIGSVYQLLFLFCCFVAIWLPGSPFVLSNKWFSTHTNNCLDFTNNTSLVQNSTQAKFNTFESYLFVKNCNSYISILVLLISMAMSRFGLWLTDLVINQIIQESIDEKERGVIGGVQSSLNRIFDLIKFVSVMLLSDVSQYGYLVIISVSAVFIAFCLYTIYAVKQIITHRYSKVPYSETGPFRKSMIEMKPIEQNQPKLAEPEDIADFNDDVNDSFDEEQIQNEPDKKS